MLIKNLKKNFTVTILVLLAITPIHATATTLNIGSSPKNFSFDLDTSGDYSQAAIFGGGLSSGDGNTTDFYLSLSTPPSNANTSSPFLYQGSIRLYGMVMDKYSNNLISAGISVGGGLGYRFLTQIPTAIMLQAQIAPNPLNMYEAKWVYYGAASFEAMILPSFIGYIGYRYKHATFDNDGIRLKNNKIIKRYTYLSDPFIGVKLKF